MLLKLVLLKQRRITWYAVHLAVGYDLQRCANDDSSKAQRLLQTMHIHLAIARSQQHVVVDQPSE